MMNLPRLSRCVRLLAASALLVGGVAQAQDKVTFATNWRAQATHGGFFQAVADGTYKKYGLEVEIQQGCPQVNNRAMLPAAGERAFRA